MEQAGASGAEEQDGGRHSEPRGSDEGPANTQEAQEGQSTAAAAGGSGGGGGGVEDDANQATYGYDSVPPSLQQAVSAVTGRMAQIVMHAREVVNRVRSRSINSQDRSTPPVSPPTPRHQSPLHQSPLQGVLQGVSPLLSSFSSMAPSIPVPTPDDAGAFIYDSVPPVLQPALALVADKLSNIVRRPQAPRAGDPLSDFLPAEGGAVEEGAAASDMSAEGLPDNVVEGASSNGGFVRTHSGAPDEGGEEEAPENSEEDYTYGYDSLPPTLTPAFRNLTGRVRALPSPRDLPISNLAKAAVTRAAAVAADTINMAAHAAEEAQHALAERAEVCVCVCM